MSNAIDFLNALAGEYVGALSFLLGEEVVAVEDVDWIREHAGELSLAAGNPDGTTCFVYGFDTEADRDSWKSYRMTPTAVLFKDGYGAISFWALEATFPQAEVEPLAQALEMTFEEFVPLPGVGGWELIHCNPNIFQPLGELTAVYGARAEENPAVSGHEPDIDEDDHPEEIQEVAGIAPVEPDIIRPNPAMSVPEEALPWEEQRFGEALIKTPGYWPESDPQLHQTMIVSRGGNAESKRWVPTELPIGGFIGTLCFHKEGPKDGAAFVCGEVVGDRRTANAMKALYAVGLDIDVGMPSAAIDELLVKLGALAVRYTTHSHMKTISEFRKDAVIKFAEDREVDDELVRDFLKEVHKVEPRIADSAIFMGFEHEEGGIVARIEHDRWPKNRIVLPLKEPFVIADEGRTQKDAIEKWKKVPAALAAHLGVPIDRTGVDPSRLFFYPRHRKGSPHEIALFGGELFDWRSLELDDPFATLAAGLDKGAKTSKSKTPEGRDLGRWSMKCAHGFQIVDLLRDQCEDRVRGNASHSGVTIECPFDEMHSNAGEADDAACFAVNAGDGPSEWFTVKCQHDSCRDYTMLDMVGKMVKDGWFDRSCLDEEAYNAAAPEEAPNPEVAIKIAEQDDARDGIEDKVNRVTKDASIEEVRDLLKEIVRTGDRLIIDKLSKQVKARCGLDMKTVRGIITEFTPKEDKAKQDADGARPGEELYNKKTGVTLFRYYSEFNKDEGTAACMRALKRANDNGMPMYSCNLNEPVQLRTDDDGRVQFYEMNGAVFWSELCERIQFQRITDAGAGARDQVPDKVAAQLFNTAWKHLPPTPEVIYTPMFNPEGQVITTPGWYPDLRILLVDTGFVVDEVTPDPDDEELQYALHWLKTELLSDFPFLDIDEVGTERREPSEANALAMLITPFMRRMIDGCTPVFFVSKPTPGTGGTLLGKLPMLLFDGEESFPLGYYRDNEDEQRKSLISAIMETRSHLFFDDVKEFNNRVLLQSITARKLGGRLLGKSQNVERPNTFNWVATGNNPFIGNEMERRINWIRLNAKTADIQNRKFRHKNFPAFVKEERAKAVWCILTLIQSWIARGREPFEERSLTSFEEWARMVGGVLQNAGVEGFLDNRRAVSMDMDFAAAREFISEWLSKFGKEGVTPKALIDHAMLMELDIVEGNNDDQKRFRLRRRLEALEGVTFEVGSETLMVRRIAGGDGTPVYILEPLVKAEAKEAA